jgi:signal transduction histidine kinase
LHLSRNEMSASPRIILFVVAAVATSFLAAAVYSEHRTAKIQTAALDISENAAPSIEQLTAARADLRDLQHHALQTMLSPLQAPQDLQGMLAAHNALHHDMLAYERFPQFPGEAVLAARMKAHLQDVDDATAWLAKALRAEDKSKSSQALQALDTAVEIEADDLMHNIELNARFAHDRAVTIRMLKMQGTVVVILLDGVAVLFAALLAYLGLKLLAERERSLRRRTEELDMFAGRVAHDILSPLSAVDLSLSTAERVLASGMLPRLSTVLARAHSSVGRALVLVDGLLQFARAGAKPSKAQCADLMAVLAGVVDDVRDVARKRQVELSVAALPAAKVACSPGVLTSISSNLLKNAVKYVATEPRRVYVTAVAREGWLRVEVEDSGPGVPAPIRDRIFEPFVRAPGTAGTPGIGLGLATVRRLVEGHGGRLGVECGEVRRCVFWFELPLAPVGAPA